MRSTATQDSAPTVTGQSGHLAFIVMMSSQAAQSLLFGLTPALLPAMSTNFGANGQFIAQMVSALAALGLMITSIFSGQAARILGVRRLVILAALVFGAAGLVPAMSASVTVLLGSRLLAGGAAGLLTTGCALLLAHTYSGTARSKAMGYQTALGSVIGLVGLVGAGALVGPFGWQLPFLVYGIFALPVAALAFVGVPDIRLQTSASGQGLGRALVLIWPVCAAGCLLMMVPLCIGSNVPFVLTGIGVTAPLTQSVIIAGTTVMSAVGGSVFGKVQGRLGVKRTFAVALLLTAAGMGCIGLAATGWMVGLGCVLAGIAVGFYVPHLVVLSTTLVPEAMRGHSVGLLTTSFFLGGFLYPFLVGALQKLFGLSGALQVIAALLALGSVAVLFSRRTRLNGFASAGI
jgi:MFS family permease